MKYSFKKDLNKTSKLIFIIFFVLKCLGQLNHSWWFVFSPFFIAVGIGTIIDLIKKYKQEPTK